jgi:transposase
MAKRRKRTYTLEFKRQAADLAIRNGVKKAAEQLGVSVTTIQPWKAKFQKKNELKLKSSERNFEEENRNLRKENEELKKINLILKKAAALFSQDQLK